MAFNSSKLTPAELTRSELIRRYGSLEEVRAQGSLDHAANLMVQRYELSSRTLRRIAEGKGGLDGSDPRAYSSLLKSALGGLKGLTVSRGFAALRWRRSYYAWLFGSIPLSPQERREFRADYEEAQEDAKLPEARAQLVIDKLYSSHREGRFNLRIPEEKRYHMGVYLLGQALAIQLDAVAELDELNRSGKRVDSQDSWATERFDPRSIARVALEKSSAIELPERGDPYILEGR